MNFYKNLGEILDLTRQVWCLLSVVDAGFSTHIKFAPQYSRKVVVVCAKF